VSHKEARQVARDAGIALVRQSEGHETRRTAFGPCIALGRRKKAVEDRGFDVGSLELGAQAAAEQVRALAEECHRDAVGCVGSEQALLRRATLERELSEA
jgi:hypothetical protein